VRVFTAAEKADRDLERWKAKRDGAHRFSDEFGRNRIREGGKSCIEPARAPRAAKSPLRVAG
jgi:hypothetical protein